MESNMLPRHRLSLRTVLRSAGVGAVASWIDFAVLATLVSGLGFGPRTANIFALGAGLTGQFIGNKLFAFEDKRPRWGRQAAVFGLIELFAFSANLVLFDIAVRWLPLPYLIVRVMTQATVYFGFCLPLWSRVFERAEREVSS
jgi:putative flippase GtrA